MPAGSPKSSHPRQNAESISCVISSAALRRQSLGSKGGGGMESAPGNQAGGGRQIVAANASGSPVQPHDVFLADPAGLAVGEGELHPAEERLVDDGERAGG